MGKSYNSLSELLGTLVALFTLSLVYVMPSNIKSCAADTKWLDLFKKKDAIAIRDYSKYASMLWISLDA